MGALGDDMKRTDGRDIVGTRIRSKEGRDKFVEHVTKVRAEMLAGEPPAGETRISFVLNGEAVIWQGDPSRKLLDVLRDDLALTGVKCGCREGECGACSVLLGGRLTNSCLVAAGRVQGCEVVTIEGYRQTERFKALDQSFAAHSAVQCGYCIPGMALAGEALLACNPRPAAGDAREAISGNLCRCTGYNAIVDAILDASVAGDGLWATATDGHAPGVAAKTALGCPMQGAVAGSQAQEAFAGGQVQEVVASSHAQASDKHAPSATMLLPANSHTPTTLAEALELLASEKLIPYAGGTDLMVKEEHEHPFLFLHNIAELKGIKEDAEFVRIGAAVTYSELLEDARTPPILREAISTIAAPAIRNVATLGGNITNASPKGDGALVCFATDALLRLVRNEAGRIAEGVAEGVTEGVAEGVTEGVSEGVAERIVPISEFYLGRGKTVLGPDELLAEILIPKRWLVNYSYCKVGARKALAISRVSFAGLLALDAGIVAHLAMAFGAVEDIIIRKPQLDAMLIGKTLEKARALKGRLLDAYNEAIVPIRGRVSAEYRKQVCLNLIEDFLDSQLADSSQPGDHRQSTNPDQSTSPLKLPSTQDRPTSPDQSANPEKETGGHHVQP